MLTLDELAWNNGRIQQGRPLLLVHQAIEGDDFMPAGWCGGCDTCVNYPASAVCAACSYGPDGMPVEPVDWPCAVVCGHTRLYARARAMTRPCGSCDGGLPMACTCSTDDPRELVAELAAEVRRLSGMIAMAVDSRHTLG